MKKKQVERKQWTTTFDQDLRKKVNITAAELDTTPNIVLEVAYIYLKANWNKEEAEEILATRK